MKIQTTLHSITKKVLLAVAGVAGLLAYGNYVVVPGYSGVIDEYHWSVNRQRNPTLAPMPIMTPMMMSMAPAGEHHKPLRMVVNIPGITRPNLVEVNATTVDDDASVFGIIVNGKAFAFARDALLHPRHIVNLLIDQKPISVTYCDLVDCVRVLTREDRTDPIDLHVGGLDITNQMVFLLDGVRYGQSSTDIPLEDVPVERTTFGEWKKQHPTTLVYGG